MECSTEEAFSLFFNKWRHEATWLMLAFERGGVGHCQITEASSDAPIVQLRLQDSTQLLLSLAEARFSYKGSRAGVVPKSAKRKWARCLLAEFPTGRTVVLAEPCAGIIDLRTNQGRTSAKGAPMRRKESVPRHGGIPHCGSCGTSTFDLNLSEISPVVRRFVQYSPSKERSDPLPILRIAAPSWIARRSRAVALGRLV